MSGREGAGARPRHAVLAWPGMEADGVLSAVAFTDPGGAGPGWHRGLPSAGLTLIIGTVDPFLVGGGTDGPPSTQQSLPSLVGGLQRTGAWTRRQGVWAGVHLGLDPLAGRRLLGMPAAELAPGRHGHTTVAADAVLPDELSRLAEQLATRPSATADLIAGWVRGRPAAPSPRPEVAAACRLICRRGGRVRIGDVARHVHLSPRQLRSLVRAELGVGPKHLARLARFERAAAQVGAGGRRTLAEVAHATGHADLAHLDAEWRDLVGCSPTTWLASERRNVQA
ncbi:helix-turn-helix domain-containing protein [Serinicoccus kebangsaanensis]|uniref:helix-turn-helix domain-containing protein n=1 Tax=Serinicoccus kebangsaanensis TaxID=2602069 RepID=UPI00124E2BAB|nr:helix-turn-helix domain-containing protein [Serinicoccus kebangsaanensis]